VRNREPQAGHDRVITGSIVLHDASTRYARGSPHSNDAYRVGPEAPDFRSRRVDLLMRERREEYQIDLLVLPAKVFPLA
jgi:hypothetical protein